MVLPASSAGTAAVTDRRWWVHRSAWFAAAALLVIAAVAWVSVVRDASAMASGGDMPGEGMSDDMADAGMAGMDLSLGLWAGAAYVGAWGVMMAAMMLPSAIPMVALYSLVGPRMAARHGSRAVSTAVFAGLYAVVWLLTGVVVYLGAVAVSVATSASPALADVVPYGIAAVLIGAGVYQFSAAKRICLQQCRSPLDFLALRWRPGVGAAVRVGLAHAAYCVGCCWALMVVLVAAGAMGLIWVLLIAVLVLAEKVLPYGERTAWVVGGALIGLGVVVGVNPDLVETLLGSAA